MIGLVPSICVRLFPVGVRLSNIALPITWRMHWRGALLPVLLIYFSRKLMLSSALLSGVCLCDWHYYGYVVDQFAWFVSHGR